MGFKFERLEVWRLAIDFADAMFDIADRLPNQYQFSLGEQLRRASLSIPTNIAEGTGRDSGKESMYFYRISKGSAYEVISLLVMLQKRSAISEQEFQTHYQTANKIAAMISNLKF